MVGQVIMFAIATTHGPLPPCPNIPPTISMPLDPQQDFFIPSNLTYFNPATLGPMPRAAFSCATDLWRGLSADPAELYDWGGGPSKSRLDAVRMMTAEFLGAKTDEIELVQSTTIALNNAIDGLVSSGRLRKEQIVITTDQEHGGGVAAYKHLVARGAVAKLETVALPAPPPSADAVVQLFAAAFAKHPAGSVGVLGVSHVLTTTGMALPLSRLAALAHAHGAMLVVDGAQAATAVNLNVTGTGADVYATSGHKHLLGPTGSGVLYVRKSSQKYVTPTLLDGGYAGYSQSSGTAPLQTIAGLGYSLALLSALGGMGAVAKHNNDLAGFVYDGFASLAKELPGLHILSPARGSGLDSSLVSLQLPPTHPVPKVLHTLRKDYGMVVKHLPDHEGGTPLVYNGLRVSTHVYNSKADVQRLMSALRASLGLASR